MINAGDSSRATIREVTQYPSGAEIARVMREVSPRLRAALTTLDSEQLNRPASLPIPGMKTFADELTFFALHDAYHVGAIGLHSGRLSGVRGLLVEPRRRASQRISRRF